MMKSFISKLKHSKDDRTLKEPPKEPPEEPPERSSAQIHEAAPQPTLGQMNIALKLMSPQAKDYGVYKTPMLTLLEDGKDPTAATSYSFAKFKAVFEQQLEQWVLDHMNILGQEELNYTMSMDYGRIHCVRANGEINLVVNQNDFAVAINGLHLKFLKYGLTDDDLNFLYQPEFEVQRKERLEKVENEKKEAQEALDRRPAATSGTDETRPGTSSSQIPIRTPNHPLAGPSEETTSDAATARVLVREVLTKAGARIPETKAAEHERFKTLYKEKSRARYKRGGNEKQISAEEIRRLSAVDHEIADGEADDLEMDVEEEEGEDVDNADRIVAKLQELTKLQQLTQVDAPWDVPGNSARWKECCAMFRCDPSNIGIENKLKVAGLRTPIYQYQALGVYWQMLTARELGGGFLADDMGLGKTLSFLAYVVVERQLAVLHRRVNKSRIARDGLHLPEGQFGVCPTVPAEGWIICPCSSSSPTSKMPLQPGLRMACVPSPVVRQWWNQWKLHVDTTESSLGLKLVIDHPPVFKDAKFEDMSLRATAPQNKGRMEPIKATKNAKRNDEPKENNDCILLLTTQADFPEFVKGFSSDGFIHNPKDSSTWIATTAKQKRNAFICGIAMIDECHEEYFRNKGRAKTLTDLPRCNSDVRPFIFGYSGTPFSQTPRGIEGVLWAIEKHSDVVDQSLSWARLDQICKEFDVQLKNDVLDLPAVDSCLEAFKSFLTNFMIRRTADTIWFGHSLVEMKPHIHTDVTLEPKEALVEDIRNYEKQFDFEREVTLQNLQLQWDDTAPELRRSNIRPTKLGFNVMIRAHWRSRLLSTFPYLYRMTSAEGKDAVKLTAEETQGFLRAPVKDTNPYKKQLRNIVESSPKCIWLYHFIHQLKAERDVEGNPHKLVIMTSFPQVAYILHLFVLRYFPEYKELVGLVAGRMKPSDKVKIINAFTGNADDNGRQRSTREVRILIGITRSVGVGLQLQKACHVVLMEPDYEFVNELQAYGRVHRIGQKNPLSRSFRLIDDGSDIEKLILKRQEDRKEVAGTRIME